MAPGQHEVRLAAIGDLHCTKTSQSALQPLFQQINERADVLLLCGDLTDYGLPEEAQVLAKELIASLKIPVIAVLGNHDFESAQVPQIQRILSDAGVKVLDGDGCELHGIGFAGAMGFAGGFGDRALQAWGEESTKQFVREAIDEALKLESAISRLQTAERIVLLHYSPIRATVEGESVELFPFLGSSRIGLKGLLTLVANCPALLGTPEFMRLTLTKEGSFVNSPPVSLFSSTGMVFS